jgi:hypothetical protein
MSTIYIFQDGETGEISISAYQADSDMYENNHIMLAEMRNGKVNKHESVLNIVRNVLSLADITVVFDE